MKSDNTRIDSLEQSRQQGKDELLIRIDEKVKEVLRRMDGQDQALNAFRLEVKTTNKDFDKRISTLEDFRWWLAGVSAVVVGIIGIWVHTLGK